MNPDANKPGTTAYDVTRNMARVHGIDLHHVLEGDAKKPTLVLVNMASHNLTCWEVVLAPLLEHFQVLRFDLRGTGKSGWGDKAQFNFAQYADDLAGLMRHLGIKSAFVVGVAYGARTAAQFALRHPTMLSGLGLFDVALTPPVDQGDQGALGAKAMAMLKDAGMAIPERQKYWRFYENRDAALACHTAHQREGDTMAALSAITAPTLVACGRQDMNLDSAREIAALIPGATFAVMEMTGHGSVFYRPDEFVRLVTDFRTSLIDV